MSARPLIIDCDPGQDDAVALLLAFASAEALDLRGITAVAGNVPLALTESNARRIRDLAGCPEVPVYAGCPRPMVRTPETAEYIHGPTGIDGADLPEPSRPAEPVHAVDYLVDTLAAAEEPITLATLGPLTNVALAIVKDPSILGNVREIVTMGGAVGLGNVTPAAEFNIHADPHAAHVVFEAGVPLTMIGLDVTHQAIATPERLEAIRALGTAAAAAVCGMLDLYGAKNIAVYHHGGAASRSLRDRLPAGARPLRGPRHAGRCRIGRGTLLRGGRSATCMAAAAPPPTPASWSGSTQTASSPC